MTPVIGVTCYSMPWTRSVTQATGTVANSTPFAENSRCPAEGPA
jgi:hypothetical protein